MRFRLLIAQFLSRIVRLNNDLRAKKFVTDYHPNQPGTRCVVVNFLSWPSVPVSYDVLIINMANESGIQLFYLGNHLLLDLTNNHYCLLQTLQYIITVKLRNNLEMLWSLSSLNTSKKIANNLDFCSIVTFIQAPFILNKRGGWDFS